MLHIHRSLGQQIRLENTETRQIYMIKLVTYGSFHCFVRVNKDRDHLLEEGDTAQIDDCLLRVLRIGRGVKFGLDAPRHILIERI